MRQLRSFRLALLSAALLLAACGDEADTGTESGSDTSGAADTGGSDGSTDGSAVAFVAPKTPAIQPVPTPVCQVDLDCGGGDFCFVKHCASQCSDERPCEDGTDCDARGRCGGGLKSIDDNDRSASFRIVEPPSRRITLARNATEVRVELRFEGDSIPANLAYRAEDGLGLLDATIVRSEPIADGIVTIVLPFDAAALVADEEQSTQLRIDTQAGLLRFDLNVAALESGTYETVVLLSSLGNTEVPLSFEVVTSPLNVPLSEATAAWLVLSNQGGSLFAPSGDTSVAEQARPLVFDELLQRWVASFRNDYVLPEGAAVRTLNANPQRTLRFELGFEAPTGVFGRVTDRWTGFYDLRSTGGVLEPSPLVFDGDLEGFREGNGRVSSDLVPAELAPVRIEPQGEPALDACTDAMFPTIAGATGDAGLSFDAGAGRIYRCEAPERILGGGTAYLVDSVASFRNAADAGTNPQQVRTDCALAVAETALASGTTAELLLQFFDGDGVTPGGRSFDAFMQDCAQGVDGLCRPSPEVLCARQLLAYAYATPTNGLNLDDSSRVSDAFERASREAFLGQQLGAFQTDAALRLSWLKSTDFPAIVTAVLQSFVGGLLTTWQTSVLDVQLGVVSGQYDPAALAILGRQVSGPEAAKRKQMLLEMSQSWRGAVDALGLGARRWNELLKGDAERAERSAFVSTRTLDFYLYAGLGSVINLRSDAGFANAIFSGGLSTLSRDASPLALPFSELIYARDGDVVVTQSLDPASSNFNLLSRREEAATAALEAASASVGTIITESTERELSSAQIQNQLNNEIGETVDQLIELCGLPLGCTRDEVLTDAACRITVEVSRCGFQLALDGSGVEEAVGTTVSEAAQRVAGMGEAVQAALVASAELEALSARAVLAGASADAFGKNVEAWNETRLASVAEVDQLITERADAWTGSLATITANIAEQNRLRGELAEDAKKDAANWKVIRDDGVESDYDRSITALALDNAANGLESAGSGRLAVAGRAADAFPSLQGTSNNVLFRLHRKILQQFSVKRTIAAKVLQLGVRAGGAFAARKKELVRLLRDAELEGLADADIGEDFESRNNIAALSAAADLELTAQQVAEYQVDRLIAAMRTLAEAELAYERDKVELRDRREKVLALMQDIAKFQLDLTQAQTVISERVLQVAKVSQNATLLDARLRELELQRSNIVSIIGSPSVVFAWANKLAQAESQLDRAKAAMMDWLVAMEYYAVRPFMDQRIQILLARNTTQLEAIAAEMQRLTSACGGNTNTLSVTVSLAKLLNFTTDRTDAVDGASYAPAEQFRAALERADVAVSRRAQLGGEIATSAYWANPDVWAIEFPVDIASFPNLASSCNAKVLSFDFALIGDGLGDALPTVTMVHSGSSRLRSCQPDLNDYVAQFGEGATRFADLTRLRTAPRSISPVAEVGGFANLPDLTSGNVTLGGLPLASDYVVVIDRGAGENPQIDWENLEDIKVRVNFTFQDFFPRGDCQ
jgi:hypothetical protein